MDFSGLVLTALSLSFTLASKLYSYGQNVKGARRDIQTLSNELFGLIGVLEHLKLLQEQSHADEADSSRLPRYCQVEQLLGPRSLLGTRRERTSDQS